MSENKCYSQNGEEFNCTEIGDLLQNMADDGDLKEGAEYWEGEARHQQASEFFDAQGIIEDAAERACEAGGDYAEDFGDVSKEAVAELDGLLAAWANKHCTVKFWTVSNVKKVTVTAELAAEYNDDDIGA